MIQKLRVNMERYDTRLSANLVYTCATNGGYGAVPLHMHIIFPIGTDKQTFPLLINVGGGGWRISAPERHLPELAFFAENGFIVASIEYRTTAHSRFPTQVEDVKTAIRYLRKNSQKYHINPEKIYLMGCSAGAHLAAMAALTADTGLFSGDQFTDQSESVQGAIGLYGLYDFTKHMFEESEDCSIPTMLELFLPNMEEETLALASPVHYVSRNRIPFLLLHGMEDRQVSYQQSVLFHDCLSQFHNDVQLYLLEGADHADGNFSQPEVQNIILDFLHM